MNILINEIFERHILAPVRVAGVFVQPRCKPRNSERSHRNVIIHVCVRDLTKAVILNFATSQDIIDVISFKFWYRSTALNPVKKKDERSTAQLCKQA